MKTVPLPVWCLALLAVLPSCLPKAHDSASAGSGAKSPPIAVLAEPVTWSDAAPPVVAPGLLARTLEADLSFKTGGVVAEVNVRAGDDVRAGQVLGSLRMEELDAAVVQADSALVKARRDLERISTLVSKNVEPLEKEQNAASDVEQAEAALQAAQFNRQTAVLSAPAAGRVLARFAEPGEIAAAGRTILRFASDAEGWLVRVGLSQRDVVRIQAGDGADVVLAGLSGSLRAEVVRIAGEADPASRTTLVELRLAGPPPTQLRSGMVARVEIEPRKREARPVLPLSALVEGDGRTAHVFALAPACQNGETTVVRRLPVEIDGVSETGAVVSAGLEDRDLRVVTTGAELLSDGAEVLVNPPWPLASK